MKYIIKESNLKRVITKYLDTYFPIDDVRQYLEMDYDEKTGEDFDDETHVIFYPKPYDNYFQDYLEDTEIFHWYSCEYFYDNAPQKRNGTCPILVISSEIVDGLNSLFDNDWEEPFKTWFTKRYNLPITTLESERLIRNR